ncbi:MAG: tetratricopeptide repeat protein [Streptosporangiales bacterium]|nr:tetratricopeptide repeat protein [Streptosporangiales bacterium]
MSSQNFSTAGAVDLSALANRSQAPAPPAGGAPTSALVIDVSEEAFETDVLQRSMSVPVVIDFWAEWCQPCKSLSPILEQLTAEYAGRFVLAKVDIEANQQLAQAAQVQSIPMVVGVLKGQVVPLFMGGLPEDEVRRYLDELLKVAAANGVTGTVTPDDGPAEEEVAPEPAVDPRFAAADEALGRGDVDAAVAAYEKVLATEPADETATIGLARAKLLGRTKDLDVAQVRAAAAADPTDVSAQLRAADVDVYAGNVDDAFNRLVATVKKVSGDERDTVRQHLLDLFAAVGPKDPRVANARRALANALF